MISADAMVLVPQSTLDDYKSCKAALTNIDKVMETLAERRDELLKDPRDSYNYGRGAGLDEVLFIFGQPSRLFK